MKPRGAGGRNWHWYGAWGKYLVWSSFGFGGRRYFHSLSTQAFAWRRGFNISFVSTGRYHLRERFEYR